MSLANNYARAFYEESKAAGASKETQAAARAEIASFWQIIESAEGAKIALVGPVTSAKEKALVTEEFCSKLKLSKGVTRFLVLIAQNHRIGQIPAILAALEEVRVEQEGGVLGKIVSADPLDPSDVKSIAEAFGQKLGKKVEFQVSTEPGLLAGLRVTLNGVTYDGTLRSQLNRLKESFVEGVGIFH